MNFDSNEFDNFEMPDFSDTTTVKQVIPETKPEISKGVQTKIIDKSLQR
jgi:hypothetical protein